MYGADYQILCGGFETEVKLQDEELRKRQELLCENYSAIRSLVEHFGVPKNDQDDLIQEIFIKAYQNVHQLRDPEKMTSWLYKIAYRYIQKDKTKVSRRNDYEISLEAYPVELIERQVKGRHGWTVDDHYLFTDEMLLDMIGKLNATTQNIFRLRFEMGFTLLEISEILNMNYNTVKTIETRGFKKLKKMIEDRSMGNEDDR